MSKPSIPGKPYPEYPLSAHASGRFVKKIMGKHFYFGKWARRVDGELVPYHWEHAWKEALKEYKDRIDDIRAGVEHERLPQVADDDLKLHELLTLFVEFKQRVVERGELKECTLDGYKRTCQFLADNIGRTRTITRLKPADFTALRQAMDRRWGPHRVATEISKVRHLFKWALESEYLDKPQNFGPGFRKPRKANRKSDKRHALERQDILRLIKNAGTKDKAVLLLAINCGYGNEDCSRLQRNHLDLENGFVTFPRPKTEQYRRAKLWPETQAALSRWLKVRPESRHKEHENYVFVNRRGRPMFHKGNGQASPIAFAHMAKRLGIQASFYDLRHSFRDVADAVTDVVAINTVMGHKNPGMRDTYTHSIADERIERVCQHVRDWLYAKQEVHNAK